MIWNYFPFKGFLNYCVHEWAINKQYLRLQKLRKPGCFVEVNNK